MSSCSLWPYPRVIVHRCGGSLTPENTVMGVQKALELNVPAIEFDTMLSADKVPMLMHDDELTRTASCPNYAGKFLNSFSAAELKKIDVGSYFDEELSGVYIPSLEDIIMTCAENKVFMNIEIKPAKGHEMRTGIVVAETVLKYHEQLVDAGVSTLFSSFSFDALKAAKEVAPDIPRGFLIHEPLDTVEEWKVQVKELDVVSVHTNADNLTKLQVQEINSMGYAVFCYTVNCLKKAEQLLKWGVSCLCTDEAAKFSALAQTLTAGEQSSSPTPAVPPLSTGTGIGSSNITITSKADRLSVGEEEDIDGDDDDDASTLCEEISSSCSVVSRMSNSTC